MFVLKPSGTKYITPINTISLISGHLSRFLIQGENCKTFVFKTLKFAKANKDGGGGYA
jgi:hypothetical protein